MKQWLTASQKKRMHPYACFQTPPTSPTIKSRTVWWQSQPLCEPSKRAASAFMRRVTLGALMARITVTEMLRISLNMGNIVKKKTSIVFA